MLNGAALTEHDDRPAALRCHNTDHALGSRAWRSELQRPPPRTGDVDAPVGRRLTRRAIARAIWRSDH
eukprot:705615-Pyramimonas_sp.AAC.1